MGAPTHTVEPHRKCRDCGRPLRFVRNWNGVLMPIDPEPSAKGRIVISAWTENDESGRPRVIEKLRLLLEEQAEGVRGDGGYTYTAHHATCPGSYRKGGDRG